MPAGIETDKLGLLLIQSSWQFADESFNMVIRDADNKLVGIAHLDSGGHWEVWKAEHDYRVGDIVRWPAMKSNQYAQCISDGTSGTVVPIQNKTNMTFSDGTLTWKIMALGAFSGDGNVEPWKPNTNYDVDALCVYGGNIYRCIEAHTSGEEFDAQKWELIGEQETVFDSIVIWRAYNYYALGQYVVYGSALYRCRKNHRATVFEDDKEYWTEVCSSVRSWERGIYYYKGDTIVQDNMLWYCVIPHTSGRLFDSEEEENWIVVERPRDVTAWVSDWTPNTLYKKDHTVSFNKILWRCLAEHTSIDNVPQIDPSTGEPVINPSTGEPVIAKYSRLSDEQQYWQPQSVVIPPFDATHNDGVDLWALVQPEQGELAFAIPSTNKYLNTASIRYPINTIIELNSLGSEQEPSYYFTTPPPKIINSGAVHTTTLTGFSNLHTLSEWFAAYPKVAGVATDGVDYDQYFCVGRLVYHRYKLYMCTSACVIPAGETVIDNIQFFREIGTSKDSVLLSLLWKPLTDYVVGDLVVIDDTLYMCKEAHISGNSYDSTYISQNFAPLTASAINSGSNIIVPKGTFITADGDLYMSNKVTSNEDVSKVSSNDFDRIFSLTKGFRVEKWVVGRKYIADHDVVIVGTDTNNIQVFICIQTHISTQEIGTSNKSYWKEFKEGKTVKIWEPGVEYGVNDIVLYMD